LSGAAIPLPKKVGGTIPNDWNSTSFVLAAEVIGYIERCVE
jgi:hypothetical protein